MANNDFKYWAFISYSHQDKSWGDWLHKALETYRIPSRLVGQPMADGGDTPTRLIPIFRDREELPTATDLGQVISDALRDSRFLIVICSPRSATSRWVNEEILAYKRLGRSDRILALIVDGEPNVSDKAESPTLECFPNALKHELDPLTGDLSNKRTEPIAADARDVGDGRHDANLKLVAGLLGVGFDDLKRREMQRKQKRLIALASVTTVIMLAMVALSAWAMIAQQNAIEAREKTETALKHESVAKQKAIIESEKAHAVTRFLIDSISAVDPYKGKGFDITVRQVLDDAAVRIGKDFSDDPEIQVALHRAVGETFAGLGRQVEALRHIDAAFAIHTEHHSAKDLLAGELLELRFHKGSYEDENNIEFGNRAVGIYRNILGETHAKTASLIGDVSSAERLHGKTKQADDLFFIAWSLATLGKKNPEQLEREVWDVTRRVDKLWRMGSEDEANRELEALAAPYLKNPILKKKVPEIGTYASTLLSQRGFPHAAEAYAFFCLKKHDEIIGVNHPNSFLYRMNLATSLADNRSHLDQAIQLADESMRIAELLYGDESSEYRTSLLLNIDILLCQAGGHDQKIAELLTKLPSAVGNVTDLTPLHLAGSPRITISGAGGEDGGMVRVAQYLTKTDRLVHTRDSVNRTPLHIAALFGTGDVIRVLVEAGAKVDSRDRSGRTPLILACVNGHLEATKTLLELGANRDLVDNNKKSPLDYASLSQNDQLIRLLTRVNSGENESDTRGPNR